MGKMEPGQVFIGPLRMAGFPLFPFLSQSQDEPLDPHDVLRGLCSDQSEDFLEEMLGRHNQLSTRELQMSAVPGDKRILEKLVWPLRSAKQNVTLGHYLACISLCGMVCEMAAIFVFDLANASLVGKGSGAAGRGQVSGKQFEKFGQERRLKILAKQGTRLNQLVKDAHSVRRIRREYLHFLGKDYVRIQDDAEDAYKAAFRVVSALLALPVEKGRILVPSHLLKYLRKTSTAANA